MMAAFWIFIRALPIWQQIISGAIVLTVVASTIGITYGVWHHRVYNEGWTAAINSLAAKDQEAENAYKQAVGRADACRNSGGVWRPSSGDCERR